METGFLLSFILSPSLTTNWSQQMDAPPWFFLRFLPLKSEVFPTHCHQVRAHGGLFGSLCIIVRSLPYNIKPKKTVVEIWCYINNIEMN